LTVFIAYAVRYGYGLLLPDMLDSMGITKTDAGIISSSFFIAYTVAAPVCGLISDRYGSRWLLTTFVIALGAGALLMAYSSTILQASLSFTLAGIGAAACWAPITALAQKWSSRERRGMTLSFLDLGSALGIIIMSVVIPVIVRNFDWRAGWMMLGATGMVVGILNFFAIKNPPEEIRPPGNNEPVALKRAGMPVSSLLKTGRLWLFGLAYLLIGVVYIIPFTFMSTYAVQELSVSYTTGANTILVLGIGAVISKLIIGPLSDKTGRLKMILLCGFMLSLGSLVMAYHHIVTLFIAASIFSLGYGAIWAMYAAAASDYFGKESSGTVVGTWTVFLGVGAFLAPILSGKLADTTGTLSWSFIMGGAAGIVSLILLVPLWNKPVGNT
jgi:OFA family oxalate/formate antiporter-like MFS transporter